MAKVLTQAALDALKHTDKRQEVPDAKATGLYHILQPLPSSSRSWAYRYKVGQTSKKLTLGPYPLVSLSAARDKARKAAAERFDGIDPAAAKRAAKVAAREPAEDLVEIVAERFIARHIRANLKGGDAGGSSARETERLFRKEVVDVWGKWRMADITRKDVYKLLDAIIDRGSGYTANRTLSGLRVFFSWAVKRGEVPSNPCDGVEPPGVERKRDRVLDDAELTRLWAEAEALGAPFGSVLQLLVLTGQRLSEVARMEWSELDLDGKLWRLPAARTKNGKAHTVPLSPQAVAVIKATPRIVGDFVFTSDGRVPVDGFSRVKRILDSRLPADMPAWVLHDIRRSTATGLARIGTDIAVVERILNHTSGVYRGVVGTYQRHGFDDERRVGLDRWGRHIEALARGETEEKVVEFAARRLDASSTASL
jgi:integrase